MFVVISFLYDDFVKTVNEAATFFLLFLNGSQFLFSMHSDQTATIFNTSILLPSLLSIIIQSFECFLLPPGIHQKQGYRGHDQGEDCPGDS